MSVHQQISSYRSKGEDKHNYSDELIYSSHNFSSINIAWSVLNKHYSLVDSLTARNAAAAQHPDMKWNYFRDKWSERRDRIESAGC